MFFHSFSGAIIFEISIHYLYTISSKQWRQCDLAVILCTYLCMCVYALQDEVAQQSFLVNNFAEKKNKKKNNTQDFVQLLMIFLYSSICYCMTYIFKGMFSNSNNIILWRELKENNKQKKLFFQNFSCLIQYHVFKLCMIRCVSLCHRLLCWINSRLQEFLLILLLFPTKMISAEFLWGNVFLRGEL